MTRCAPDHGVLKDDAVCANFDRATFRYNACAKHNPAIRANGNVAAHSRGRRDVSRRINGRPFFAVRQNHDSRPNDPKLSDSGPGAGAVSTAARGEGAGCAGASWEAAQPVTEPVGPQPVPDN